MKAGRGLTLANFSLITELFPKVRIDRFVSLKELGGHKEGFKILTFEPVSIRNFRDDFSVFNLMNGNPEEGLCDSRPQSENFVYFELGHNPSVLEFQIFLF